MDEGLRRLIWEAEDRKRNRVTDEKRIKRFEEREERLLREFASNCGAGYEVRRTDGFIRAKITGEALLISDMDVELKRILQDDRLSVTFQAENQNVVMEIVIRCFSSGGRR